MNGVTVLVTGDSGFPGAHCILQLLAVRRLLGWSPRSNEEAVVATAESLVRFRLLKNA